MKKILGVLVLTIAALSITLGQTPAKPKPETKPVPDQAIPMPDQPKPADQAKPVTEPTKPVPDQSKPVGEQVATTPNAEQELIAIDKQWGDAGLRSEEHTSELQSPCNLVCRLLLEKK